MLALVLLSWSARAFYLPGVAPQDFALNDRLAIYVDKLDSSETQLPFEYYYLNYCTPDNLKTRPENLGQVLRGDRIETSPYEVYMQKDEDCKLLCERRNKRQQTQDFKWMIDNKYQASWVADNLPAALRIYDNYGEIQTLYQDGFPIGFQAGDEYFIYNHAHLIVRVHPNSDSLNWRVVGFLVHPLSIAHNRTDDLACNDLAFKRYLDFMRKNSGAERVVPMNDEMEIPIQVLDDLPPQELNKHERIIFTYSVSFEESETAWANRWDVYLYAGSEGEVHWISIINSFAMVLFLSGMVAHILSRTLRRDIDYYNSRIDIENVEETGWKQVRGDVFRPPPFSGLLAILAGSGVQLVGMAVITLFFAALGFLSPAYRGGLLTTMLLLFVFMGVFAGYTSARLYKLFAGQNWRLNALATALMFPGFCFGVLFFVNLFIWGEQSSGAVPFVTLLAVLVLWFGISVPLVFLGAVLGFRKEVIDNPCRVNRIPKPLTVVPGTQRLRSLSIMAGCLPFGCMFIELNYLMKSMWHHTLFYYLFGFLLLCFIVLIITSAEVSILLTYILLCREDYRWWWHSFTVSATSGVYLFGYACIYFLVELTLTRLSSVVLYFGYMTLAAVTYSLITGTVGFLATFGFVRKIYGAIKVE
jgi:transmembrane 9 superfamily protein 2/4